jgi:hypothetical protein
MPGTADRQAQRALLQEQWDSLDDLTARLSQRVREKPNRDVEDGPGHLPDPNVAQELILTRGRLAAVEKERDRLQQRLESTRDKLRTLRTEMRRERRQLERLGAGKAPARPASATGRAVAKAPAGQAPTLEVLHGGPDEPEVEFEGAPLPEAGPQHQAPALVDSDPQAEAAEAELTATAAELRAQVAELDDVATVLTAAEAELSGAGAEPGAASGGARWSARALFERISARWRDRRPRD